MRQFYNVEEPFDIFDGIFWIQVSSRNLRYSMIQRVGFFIRWAALGGPNGAILGVLGGLWAVQGVPLDVILRVCG